MVLLQDEEVNEVTNRERLHPLASATLERDDPRLPSLQ
jgi:hypothetical protein